MSKRRKIAISLLDNSLLVFRRELVQILPESRGISDKDTTEKVERYSSDRSTYESDMSDRLLRCHYRVINGLFKRHFNRKTHTSKIHIVQALLAKFYESESSFEKRENESDNIKNFLSDRSSVDNLNFLVMTDVVVPQEIVMLFLSYLARNENVLFHVGSICKAFYFHILNSWDSIYIEKKNVYEISLLVLNSVKKVYFVERRTKSPYIFNISELEYLFSKFNPKRLREIEICTTTRRSYEILRNFEKCVDGTEGNREVFNNIDTLSFKNRREIVEELGIEDVPWFSLLSQYSLPYSSHDRFFKIFPKVKNIKNPHKDEFATGCKTLQSFSARIGNVVSGSRRIGSFRNIYEQIAPSLRNLSFAVHEASYPEEIHLHFVNLEKVCVVVDVLLESVFAPSLNHCYSKTSSMKSLSAIEDANNLYILNGCFNQNAKQKIESFFEGETELPGGLTCFESLKELSICSIRRRAFIDLPKFETLFKQIFPNLTRFTGILRHTHEEGLKQREQTFATRLFENILPTMEYFDFSFLNRFEVEDFGEQALLQIVYSRKRTELKIRILGTCDDVFAKPIRSVRTHTSHSFPSRCKKTLDLYESIIFYIKSTLKKMKSRFSVFRRLVIIHDPDCENLEIEVENMLGNYILQEDYQNRVTMEHPLSSWFDFQFGKGITEKNCPHHLYFLDGVV